MCFSRQCHPFSDVSLHWRNLTISLSQCYYQDLLFIRWWCWLGACFSTHCKLIITKWSCFCSLSFLLHYLVLMKAFYFVSFKWLSSHSNYLRMSRFLRTSICFAELLSSNFIPVLSLLYKGEYMIQRIGQESYSSLNGVWGKCTIAILLECIAPNTCFLAT